MLSIPQKVINITKKQTSNKKESDDILTNIQNLFKLIKNITIKDISGLFMTIMIFIININHQNLSCVH